MTSVESPTTVAHGYQALAHAIAAEGVELVFGLLGGGVDRLVSELTRVHGVRFVATRHEQAALGMADGYSRATGRIGVAITTYGPGLANTGATMIAARLARSPVLLVTSDTRMRLNPMNFDQHPFILATAGALQPISSTASLAEDVQLAFRHLRLGRGPIALSYPEDVALAEVPDGWRYETDRLSHVHLQRRAPDPEAVARVADLVGDSERPVVLAGRGAVASGARDALVRLADRIGGLLATSLLARGTFAGEEFDVGLSGGFAPAEAQAILEDADLVLAFGAGLNRYTTESGGAYGGATLVQVDAEPERIGHVTPVDAAVVGDARATAEALLEQLEPQPGWRSPELARRLAAIDKWAGIDFSEPSGFASPHGVVRQLDELLPPGRLLVVDVGQFMGVPAAYFSASDYVLPWQLGYVGGGLPAATGAALGRPDRLTVAFLGDGGLMAALADLDTSVRARVPLLIVVMNDAGFGAERALFGDRGIDLALADYETPDVEGVARALGLDAYTVTSAAQLPGIVAQARIGERPTLLDVRLHPDTRSEEMSRVRRHFA